MAGRAQAERLVDLALNADMRASFNLEVPPILASVELVLKRAFNLAGRRVMALDQVGVIAVHNAHGLGEAGRRARVQTCAKRATPCREVGNEIKNLRACFLEKARFDPRGCFNENVHAGL